MKKIIFTVLVLTGMLSFAQVGERGSRPKMPTAEERVEELSESVNLTDDQKSKIKIIYENQQKEMEANISKGERPQPEKMKEAMEKQNEEIKAILSEEQYEQYNTLQQEKREKFKR